MAHFLKKVWHFLVPVSISSRSHSNSLTDLWQAGALRTLARAPRARSGRGRMQVLPLAAEFGENVLPALDYSGLAIAAFSPLHGAHGSLESPVRAALVFELPAEDGDPPENTLKGVFYPGLEGNLTAKL